MNELFSADNKKDKNPLADRMRPRTLEDIVGQDHIVGPGRLLRRAIQADRLSSIILYGPPGTGKTSLAAVIANTTRAAFENLNAVLSGVKDIREVIDRSDERYRLYSKRTILFVDEVHRWNKAQQDALLPWVENGTVILIGATTENPFFEVNRALVSRSRIFQLKPLESADLLETARRTIADKERGYGKWNVQFESFPGKPGALEHLVEVSGGDARSLLNALELAVETSDYSLEKGESSSSRSSLNSWPPPEGANIFISMKAAEESIQRRALLYDRDGDYHFDTISAFIKSVRGSDPDAALYWLAKMVRAGEDPKFIFRRMIILASEDVGLADPNALSVVISCAQAFERIGFPEGNFPLSHACLYLATAPKSNSTMAFFDALKEVEREDAEVPNHLRDGSRDKESFGHGEGYIYPHAYRDHWAAQQYLPSTLRGRTFYVPSQIGYEEKVREDVMLKRELQAAIVLAGSVGNDSDSELLTWSAAAKGREGWFKRLESGRSKLLLEDRKLIFQAASPSRQGRILIPLANDGLLLWESLRRCPEGLTAALVNSDAAKEALIRYTLTGFDEIEKPQIAVISGHGGSSIIPSASQCEEWFFCTVFDHILLRCQRLTIEPHILAGTVKELLAKNGSFILLTCPPRLGMRISRIITQENRAGGFASELEQIEDEFFQNITGCGFWEAEKMTDAFQEQGFDTETELIDQKEERLITEKDLAAWFDTEQSRWGSFIAKNINKETFSAIKETIRQRIAKGPITWQWKAVLFKLKVKS